MKSASIASGCHDGATCQPPPAELTVMCNSFEALRRPTLCKISLAEMMSAAQTASTCTMHLPSNCAGSKIGKGEQQRLEYGHCDLSVGCTVQKISLSTISSSLRYCYCILFWAVESLMNIRNNGKTE